MALAETQQLRLLERLRSAGEQPVTLDQLRAGGVDFPAVVIGELELNGYVIERVYEHGRQIGVRLLEAEAPDPPAARPRHRWHRVRDRPPAPQNECCAQRTWTVKRQSGVALPCPRGRSNAAILRAM